MPERKSEFMTCTKTISKLRNYGMEIKITHVHTLETFSISATVSHKTTQILAYTHY